MARVSVYLSLDSAEDRDLVEWLDSIPVGKRSEMIRATLRAGLGRPVVTLEDVYQAVRDLERKLEAGMMVVPKTSRAGGWHEEPPEAVAALDLLARM